MGNSQLHCVFVDIIPELLLLAVKLARIVEDVDVDSRHLNVNLAQDLHHLLLDAHVFTDTFLILLFLLAFEERTPQVLVGDNLLLGAFIKIVIDQLLDLHEVLIGDESIRADVCLGVSRDSSFVSLLEVLVKYRFEIFVHFNHSLFLTLLHVVFDLFVGFFDALYVRVIIKLVVSDSTLEINGLNAVLSINPVEDLSLKSNGDLLGLHGVLDALYLLYGLYVCLGLHLQLLAIDFLVLCLRLVHRLVGFEFLTHFQLNVLDNLLIVRLLHNCLK